MITIAITAATIAAATIAAAAVAAAAQPPQRCIGKILRHSIVVGVGHALANTATAIARCLARRDSAARRASERGGERGADDANGVGDHWRACRSHGGVCECVAFSSLALWG